MACIVVLYHINCRSILAYRETPAKQPEKLLQFLFSQLSFSEIQAGLVNLAILTNLHA